MGPPGEGCRITYDARFRLRGPLALGDPLLRPLFRKAGDDAVAGIQRALRAEAARRREGGAAGRVPDLSGEVTPETVAAIVAMDDRPVLRNLLITEGYHRIARRLDRMLGGADVNWCAYATWASKTAGAFIREEELAEAVREISTFHLMTLRGPGGVLALGDDLPAPTGRGLYPATLDPLEHPDLVATLARYGAYPVRAGRRDQGATAWKLRLRRGLARLRIALRLAPPVAFGSAARDWGDLAERMRYILVYFRSRQGERILLRPPFDPRQSAAIAEGHVPRGEL